MTKRMLIDASHPEETRVVVAENSKVDEFDYEIEDKKPLKGNIYLAKVTRVEPSLQAAFVDYGGNRHGFLPFAEIHPDYYRLPIADREALIQEEREAQRAALAASEAEASGGETAEPDAEAEAAAAGAKQRSKAPVESESNGGSLAPDPTIEQLETANSVETLADDDLEEAARRRAAILGRYKIQEVIKRRQVILVQVVKEERGTKGAALSTYLSLAGRYCVLMPNTDKGGGVSRKISSAKDRKRLKTILADLKIPEGMAVIVRTAGSERTKAEIKRDYDYLLRLWDQIRETTLSSTAPSLIYEEANLIKRSIRDLYTRDMQEVLVQGEPGYKAAKGFMRSLMPSHAKKVQRYNDPKLPIFHRFQVEQQLDNIHSPSVQLKSGGYVVINQTEALVAIDVNSGKSTKERHIEETALKTNLEAADEIARQLKLRDLAGLIVIDFIDMDAPRNNKEVEQRLKEAMRQDRARIQLGRISPFGLLELSRQRLRPSVHETSTEVCHTCGGSGFVRSPESTALHVMRALEEEGVKRGGGEVRLTVPGPIAMYILNEKRDRLYEVEQRYGFRVRVETDNSLIPPAHRLDRISTAAAEPPPEVPAAAAEPEPDEVTESAGESGGASAAKRGRRGGRKKRKTTGDGGSEAPAPARASDEANQDEQAEQAADNVAGEAAEAAKEDDEDQQARRRRRGKRGGRRRSKRRDDGTLETEADDERDERQADADETSAQPDSGSAGEGREPTVAAADSAENAAGGGAGDSESTSGDVSGASDAKSKRGRTRSSRKRTTKTRSKIAAAAEETAEHGKAKAKELVSESGSEAAPDGETAESATEKPAKKRSTRSRTSGGRTRRKSQTTETDTSGSAASADDGEAGASGSGGAEPADARQRHQQAAASDDHARAAWEPPHGVAHANEAPTERASAEPDTAEPAAIDTALSAETVVATGATASGTREPVATASGDGAPDAAVPAHAEPGAAGTTPASPPAAGETDAVNGTTRDAVSEAAGSERAHDTDSTSASGSSTEGEQQPISPFGEAAQPSGRDEAEPSGKPKRKGWWQKLLG
jgi:ribonuclease E